MSKKNKNFPHGGWDHLDATITGIQGRVMLEWSTCDGEVVHQTLMTPKNAKELSKDLKWVAKRT